MRYPQLLRVEMQWCPVNCQGMGYKKIRSQRHKQYQKLLMPSNLPAMQGPGLQDLKNHNVPLTQ